MSDSDDLPPPLEDMSDQIKLKQSAKPKVQHVEEPSGFQKVKPPPSSANISVIKPVDDFDSNFKKVEKTVPKLEEINSEQAAEYLNDAKPLKDKGNEAFKDKRFEKACLHYKDALGFLTSCKGHNDEIDKLKIICYQNLSVALNALEKYKETII